MAMLIIMTMPDEKRRERKGEDEGKIMTTTLSSRGADSRKVVKAKTPDGNFFGTHLLRAVDFSSSSSYSFSFFSFLSHFHFSHFFGAHPMSI